MSCAAAENLSRRWTFLLTGALCLLGWVDTSLAAGCHMQVRTVLGSKSSWENELVFDRSAAPLVQLPPILAKPPCHDQVPHVVDSIGARISAAHVSTPRFDRPLQSDLVFVHFLSKPIRPPLVRLDRPPRTTVAHAAGERRA